MAFIDFRGAAYPALPVTSADSAASTRGPAAALTPLELRVIELSRLDGLETLRAPRKRGWFARLILGPQPASPMLANERLEALRKLAVHAWNKGYQLPVSAQHEAGMAGFTEDQIGAVIDIIARTRAPFQRLSA